MGAVRKRNPEEGRNSVHTTAYVRISANEPLNSARRQKPPFDATQELRDSKSSLFVQTNAESNISNQAQRELRK